MGRQAYLFTKKTVFAENAFEELKHICVTIYSSRAKKPCKLAKTAFMRRYFLKQLIDYKAA